ncbi:MAG: DUF6516 family protein [Bacteroidota bacterium]
MTNIDKIKRIADVEFGNLVKSTFIFNYKLRIILIDNSFIDVYISQELIDRFGFHWECTDKDRTIYRYDNFPDKNWKFVNTFPYHFHNGSQNKVEDSPFPSTILDGFRAFMEFVRNKVLE